MIDHAHGTGMTFQSCSLVLLTLSDNNLMLQLRTNHLNPAINIDII